MWKQMLCPELNRLKVFKPSLLSPHKLLRLLLLLDKGRIILILLLAVLELLSPFIPPVPKNTHVFCKFMTMSEIDSEIDSYHCSDQLWNPDCMTLSDWLKVQAEDPVIPDLIQLYVTKELHKNRDDDSLEMKQFLHHRGALVMRNGILHCKNDTKESECLNQNTMQLVLSTTLRLQALKGCHNDLVHLGIEDFGSLEGSILLAWKDQRYD